ncbi:MAG: Coenzyme F420 hydrogenase/dehydrogenase, beta subunit C-terminal domain [Candidatus Methanofastidiosia archaeon]
MIVHTQLGVCGGCFKKNIYKEMGQRVYYVTHSLAPSAITEKFGENAVNVPLSYLDSHSFDIGVVEGPVCLRDKEESINILKKFRKACKILLGVGTCVAGNEMIGGMITSSCSSVLDDFCRYLRVRHPLANRFVDFDYSLPVCSANQHGILRFIEKIIEKDSQYLEPLASFKHNRVEEIVNQDLCMGCGTCEMTCPTDAISIKEGYPAVEEERCILCGTCYFQCPRSFLSQKLLSISTFGKPSDNSLLGNYEALCCAKSRNKKVLKVSQDGGIVTELLIYLLEKGIVDGAVVAVKTREGWEPAPWIVKTPEDVMDAAGTKYTICPNMKAIRKAVYEDGLSKLAFIGTPCQIQALRKMQTYPVGERGFFNKMEFAIGIFCMENFLFSNLRYIVEGHGGVDFTNVKKMDIGGGKFDIHSVDGDIISIPLKKTRKYEHKPCHVCLDYVGELADISVGSVGTPNGYSTVFVRSKKGLEVWNSMHKRVEATSLEEGGVDIALIEKLANLKISKNLRIIEKRKERKMYIPYL